MCKSKNFHSYLQIFLAFFLYTYNKYFYNYLQIAQLYTKTFLNKKLRDVGCWAFFMLTRAQRYLFSAKSHMPNGYIKKIPPIIFL